MKEINQKDNDIERIKAYHNIEPYLDDKGKKTVLNLLKINIENLEKRLCGKNKEIEFILIMYCLKVCEDIISFDESSSQLTNTKTPDNLIILKSGEKILIEVKSTDKKKFSISNGTLDGKIEFAKKLGYNLYFAINLKGIWGLFSSEYMKSKHGKININDFLNSQLDEVFKTISWVLPKGLKIKSMYSKSKDSGLLISHPDYGNLISYELLFEDRIIKKIDCIDDEDFILTLAMEAVQDTMSNQKQEIQKEGDITIIEEELVEDMNIINEYTFILSNIKHIISSQGEIYDYHLFYKGIVEKKPYNLLDKYQICYYMQFLLKQGVPIYFQHESNIYEYKI